MREGWERVGLRRVGTGEMPRRRRMMMRRHPEVDPGDRGQVDPGARPSAGPEVFSRPSHSRLRGRRYPPSVNDYRNPSCIVDVHLDVTTPSCTKTQ